MFKVDTKKIFLETFVAFVITEENNECVCGGGGLTDGGVCMCVKQSVNNSTEAALTHTHTQTHACAEKSKLRKVGGRQIVQYFIQEVSSVEMRGVCVCVLVIELPEVS